MTVSSRERILIWVAGLVATGLVAYVFIGMLLLPLLSQRKANSVQQAENAANAAELDATNARNRKVMAAILPRSLPNDLDFSKREYQSALTRMLLEAKIPVGYTVKEKAPDSKGIPELTKGRPAYTKIGYTITMTKVDIASVMSFLKKYYDLNLLHQITTFVIKRDDASKIDADKRAAKDRTDLNVTIVTEALMLDGAPARKTLLAAPLSGGSILGSAGLYAMENTSPELGRGIAPFKLTQILATPNREYAYVTARDVLHGPLPPYPKPDPIKQPVEPPSTPPGPDISAYIQLVTLVKTSDGSAHIEIFDKWNNYDFEINMKQKGEKLTIEAMRYLKTKKTDFYPDGRMKDIAFPKDGNMLAFADEKSSTKHLFKIYGIDGNGLILGETESKEPSQPSGGKSPKPPSKPVQDPKPSILGAMFVGVPVSKGEKFYRWEVGQSLKAIQELKADAAQKAIQRAAGALLEVIVAPSVPTPLAVPPPAVLEIAPKPMLVVDDGK